MGNIDRQRIEAVRMLERSGYTFTREEAELATLTDAIEAYEVGRWANGKTAGGKGWLKAD
jgi:hypothetical protein